MRLRLPAARKRRLNGNEEDERSRRNQGNREDMLSGELLSTVRQSRRGTAASRRGNHHRPSALPRSPRRLEEAAATDGQFGRTQSRGALLIHSLNYSSRQPSELLRNKTRLEPNFLAHHSLYQAWSPPSLPRRRLDRPLDLCHLPECVARQLLPPLPTWLTSPPLFLPLQTAKSSSDEASTTPSPSPASTSASSPSVRPLVALAFPNVHSAHPRISQLHASCTALRHSSRVRYHRGSTRLFRCGKRVRRTRMRPVSRVPGRKRRGGRGRASRWVGRLGQERCMSSYHLFFQALYSPSFFP